ncbi:MAG TPA: zf-HC2 domain-containing protein [Actinomycetota bacterium]|nr:zf-HC2 domain-containing protein [Actinomycetota bacterium]
MSTEAHEVRELLPEVALGIASGRDRARALEHMAGCLQCRTELEELSGIADELLFLAPVQQPPVGFESRAIQSMSAGGALPRRERTWLRVRQLLAAATVGLFAALLALGFEYAVSREDREFAGFYRRALEHAEGSYFGALELHDPAGEPSGLVFAYEGKPSWVFLVVDADDGSGTYRIELQTEDGASLALGETTLADGRGSFGSRVAISLMNVASVRVEEVRGDHVLTAEPRSD